MLNGKKVISDSIDALLKAADEGKNIIIIPSVILFEIGYLHEKGRIPIALKEQIEEQEIAVMAMMGEKNSDKGRPTPTWARLIRKIFEVSPLSCKKGGGKMRIIAFITSKIEIKKILKHIGQETRRPLMSKYNKMAAFFSIS